MRMLSRRKQSRVVLEDAHRCLAADNDQLRRYAA